ncbi:MAG TPA: S8 family serine peptidase, partial [Nitrososphaeraceae archaeon]|nr:S8 family serine peptidase [Nitrososphaeraceae archaeon]
IPEKRKLSTIGSPAANSSAITIGAAELNLQTSQVRVANFSSIGPVKIPNTTSDDFNNIKPDLCAPGVDILAAKLRNAEFKQPKDETIIQYFGKKLPPNYEEYYTFKSGTSMATPVSAASICLILEAFKIKNNITNDEQWEMLKSMPIQNSKNLAHLIKKLLIDTAFPLYKEMEYENNNYKKSIIFGAGMIDVDKCIQNLPQIQQTLPPIEGNETSNQRSFFEFYNLISV